MNINQGTGFRLRSCCLAVGVALAASSPAHAVTWDWGNWSGSWDNTVSYGISWRAEDADPALIGKGNGGTGEAILTDDGNLNFDQGDVFSNIVKGTSEIELDNGQFGAFGRIKYWYDYELENRSKPHGHVANNYAPNTKLDDSEFADYAKFSGLELLDLFVYGNFELGSMPLDLRLGPLRRHRDPPCRSYRIGGSRVVLVSCGSRAAVQGAERSFLNPALQTPSSSHGQRPQISSRSSGSMRSAIRPRM